MPSTASRAGNPVPWLWALGTTGVFLAACIAYHNTLFVPFLFDDRSSVLDNPTIRDLRAWREVLSPPNTATGATGRPIVNLSLAINYALGGLSPTSYHVFNIILHGLSGLTLLGLLDHCFRHSSLSQRFGTHALALAAGAALLWTVHPLLTESVTCVIQRSELLGGWFYLLTLFCFVRSIDSSRSGWWGAGAVVAAMAGVLCKEFVATAPLVALVLDRLIFAGSYHTAWQRRRWVYLGFLITWVLVAVVIIAANQRGGSVGFGLGVSPWDYLVTQSEALVQYLRLAVWPHPLVLDHGTFLAPGFASVWPQFAAVTLLLLGTVTLLVRGSAWAIPGVWFFCILAPSSSFVPLVTQTMAEHRMYLPLAAVVVSAVLVGYMLVPRKWITAVAVLTLAVVLARETIQRNTQYHSNLSIWADTVAKAPHNPRAHLNLGQALAAEGREEEAITHYREAIRLRLNYPMAHYNLGNALARSGDLADARRHLEESLRLNPAQASAQYNLGQVRSRLGMRTEAAASFEAALRLDPTHTGARFHLAQALVAERRLEEATAHLRQCVEHAPENARYRIGLAEALLATWQKEAALEQLQKAAVLTSLDAPDHYALGRGFLAIEHLQEALTHLEAAAQKQPDLRGLREAIAFARRRVAQSSMAPAPPGP